jgi:uncharacterized protein (TIGR02145 family)
MKTTHFFSLAAVFAALTLTLLSSCGTMGDGGDNSSGSQQSQVEPSSSSMLPPPPSSAYIPPPSSSSAGNVCGSQTYNTLVEFCYNNTVYTKCRIGATFVAYNPSTQFCDTDPDDYSSNKVHEKCNGNVYEPLNQSCSNGILYTTFTDIRDSKKYKYVKIGTQTWMAENLRFESSTGNKESMCVNSMGLNSYYCTSTDAVTLLYDWAAATGQTSNATLYTIPEKSRGICPVGWHLPSVAEWNTLTNYVGANAGTKLKSNKDWDYGWSYNAYGTDDYGFGAEPFGYVGSSYDGVGTISVWWTATQYNANYAYDRAMGTGTGIQVLGVQSYDNSLLKTNYLAVRCVKD